MKKLEDFDVKKVEIDSIYGGRQFAVSYADCVTCKPDGTSTMEEDGAEG